MKQFLTIIFFFSISVDIIAQEFDIRSFSADPSDLRARISGRTTNNGEPCALIDVVTNIKGMQFDSRVGIVGDVKHRDDGYEIYVAPRERSIKLLAPGYLSKDINLPEPAQAHMVYKLVLTTKGAAVAQSDLVRITFRINEANVYVRHGSNAPVMASSNNAVYDLPRGQQSFTFSKLGFEDNTMDIDVQDEALIEVRLQPGTPATTMELPGFIIVTSEPAGAEVFLNDQRVGQTPYQGRQLPGAYTLALRNHLYHDHQEQFTLAKGGTVTLPTVQLKPRFGFLKLSSSPTEAEVFLDGKLVGKSPIDGLQVESGPHSLSIRSSLYHERQENFSMADGENKSLSYTLRPAFGGLVVTSDPPGAEVFLDERLVGSTPFRENKQPSGSYNLRLELPLHSTERSQVQVKDEENTERFFALTKNYGTLAIESEGADIYLDGKKIGTGSIDHRAAPGSYTLRAKKHRHDDDTREVFLAIGQVESIKLAPKPRTGAISIMTSPFEASGAEIWIDGKKTEYKTPAVVELLEGDYEVIVKKENFNDQVLSINIKYGAESSKEINMVTGPAYPEGTVHCITGGTKVVEVRNPKTGRIWMDRNLGAERAATRPVDEKAYGDLYQWGRFSDGHQCRQSPTTDKQSLSNRPGHEQFILYKGGDQYDWRSNQNDKLWQGLKGINNPCPKGFRIPTQTEWDYEYESWLGVVDSFENVYLQISAAGVRLGVIEDGYDIGEVAHSGSVGGYWSSTVSKYGAYCLLLNLSRDYLETEHFSERANGFSVRCIKD